MLLTRVNECMLGSAYANVGLYANTTWRDGSGDTFQKGSDKLWIKLNYLKERKHHQVGEKGKVVTVSDVIPQSRLAHYGNYSYDNDRETMYNRDRSLDLPEDIPKHENRPEPWMLPEVEREFRRLTGNCPLAYDFYNGFKLLDCVEVAGSIKEKYPVLAKTCQPALIDPEETVEVIRLPNPFYRIDDLNQLELQMRINSTKNIWEQPFRGHMSILNSRCRPSCHQLRMLPSSRVESTIRLRHPPPAPVPPLTRLLDSGADLHDSRFAQTQSRTSGLTNTKGGIFEIVKKRHDLVNLNLNLNLTLLTRPMIRHDTSDSAPKPSDLDVPETVLKWLHSGYPSRSRDFHFVQDLNSELRNMRSAMQDPGRVASSFPEDARLKQPEPGPEPVHNQFLDALVRRSETLSLSQSSGSGSNRSESGQARPITSSRNSYSCTVSSLSCSPSGSETTSSENYKPKCRPILSTQYKDLIDLGGDRGDRRWGGWYQGHGKSSQ